MPFEIVVLAPAGTPGFIVELSFDHETFAEFETEAPTTKQLLVYGRKSGEPWEFSLIEFNGAWNRFLQRSHEILADTGKEP